MNDKIKNWCKEHKKVLLIGACSTVVVGTLGYFGVKIKKAGNGTAASKVLGGLKQCEDINVDLDTATVTEAWKEDGLYDFILNDFKVSDIGKLGEDMVKNIPDITEDTTLTCIMGTTKSN